MENSIVRDADGKNIVIINDIRFQGKAENELEGSRRIPERVCENLLRN